MKDEDGIADSIYLVNDRVLYARVNVSYTDENGTTVHYDWKKIDFKVRDQIVSQMGIDPRTPGLSGQFQSPVYIFGNESLYSCVKGAFGNEVFTPAGNVFDMTAAEQEAFDQLVNSLKSLNHSQTD